MISIFLALCISCMSTLQVAQAAQWQYSSNPNDYDFGWLANGTYASGSEPYCTYCVNGLSFDTTYTVAPADVSKGPFWNHSVGTYRCDGVQSNELWAYHEPTKALVFRNLTTVLCIDAVAWNSLGLLKLRPCNSSAVSQQWTIVDNRVTSTVLGPKGEQLFMVGTLPSKETNPTSQVYEYGITLKSSLPAVSDPGFFYTSTFTFLSTKNLVDSSTYRFTTEGLLKIGNSAVNEIVNGGFESSTIQAGSDITWSDWNQPVPSYFALCGWVIDYGPIDYVKSGLLASAEGSYSVHLNTHSDEDHWGQISQTFTTESGKEYSLSFYLNGFPPHLQIESRPTWQCSPTYTEVRLQVRVTNAIIPDNISSMAFSDGTGFQENFSMNVTNSNSLNIESLWQHHTVNFRAFTNVTTIIFTSLNFNNSCGPMVDGVAVSRIPVKSFWTRKLVQILVGSIGGLAVFIAISLSIVYGRRFFEAEEDMSGLYKTENARVFSVKELSFSTKKFSAVLGEGAFGTVYKADFPDGREGAVKVEKSKSGMMSSKVLASDEIAVLLRVHHRNLVNLTGFCIHKGRHMLVFEYLPNGCLFERLHQSVIPIPPESFKESMELRHLYANVLPWDKRVKIASDVAYGLEYLHHDANPPIVHRDVKSRNILLTSTDSAKLADFGLSRSAPPDATAFQSIETMVRGSIGYLDPQYFLTGVFSSKSDVYSYGVVLLELISGHPAIYNAESLSSWAAPYLTSPSLYHELVDKKLNGKFETNELDSLVELSKVCMQEDSKMRPTMRQVIGFLISRNLITIAMEESPEKAEKIVSREAYHKMHPLFVDFVSVKDLVSSENLHVSSSQPRD